MHGCQKFFFAVCHIIHKTSRNQSNLHHHALGSKSLPKIQLKEWTTYWSSCFFKSCICLYHGTCILGISDQIQVPALLLACNYYLSRQVSKMAYLCVLYFLQASKVIIIFDNWEGTLCCAFLTRLWLLLIEWKNNQKS